MEKIKAALHIHDKTQVPNDGAVGNIQNPSASDPNGPTAAELWGAGNKDTVYHPNRKADTVAAAAAEAAKGRSQPTPEYQGSQDDAYAHAQQAQHHAPAGNDAFAEKQAIAQDPSILQNPIPEEMVGSSDVGEWTQLEPRNQPEPAAETGPGTHFRPDTATATTRMSNTAPTGSATGSAGGEAGLNQQGATGLNQQGGQHTAYYDAATGRDREPHSTQ